MGQSKVWLVLEPFPIPLKPCSTKRTGEELDGEEVNKCISILSGQCSSELGVNYRESRFLLRRKVKDINIPLHFYLYIAAGFQQIEVQLNHRSMSRIWAALGTVGMYQRLKPRRMVCTVGTLVGCRMFAQRSDWLRLVSTSHLPVLLTLATSTESSLGVQSSSFFFHGTLHYPVNQMLRNSEESRKSSETVFSEFRLWIGPSNKPLFIFVIIRSSTCLIRKWTTGKVL